MVRSLFALEDVRVPFFEGKACPAVLQCKATSFRHDTRTDTGIVGKDETASIAVRVGCSEVDGIARSERRAASDIRSSLLWVEELCSLAEVFLCTPFSILNDLPTASPSLTLLSICSRGT